MILPISRSCMSAFEISVALSIMSRCLYLLEVSTWLVVWRSGSVIDHTNKVTEH